MNAVKFYLGLGLSGVSYLLGGFDMAIQTLIIVIVIDYLTGIMNAICKRELSSYLGWKGFMKKTTMFLAIIVAVQLERAVGHEGTLRNLVAYGFVVNEGISILENMDELGVKVPAIRKFLKKMQDKDKEDDKDDRDKEN